MRGVFIAYARLHDETEEVRRAAFGVRTVEDAEALLARFYAPPGRFGGRFPAGSSGIRRARALPAQGHGAPERGP